MPPTSAAPLWTSPPELSQTAVVALDTKCVATTESPMCVEQSALRSLAHFRAIRDRTTFRLHAPTPSDLAGLLDTPAMEYRFQAGVTTPIQTTAHRYTIPYRRISLAVPRYVGCGGAAWINRTLASILSYPAQLPTTMGVCRDSRRTCSQVSGRVSEEGTSEDQLQTQLGAPNSHDE